MKHLTIRHVTPDLEHLLSIGDDGTIRKFRLPSEVIQRLKGNDASPARTESNAGTTAP